MALRLVPIQPPPLGVRPASCQQQRLSLIPPISPQNQQFPMRLVQQAPGTFHPKQVTVMVPAGPVRTIAPVVAKPGTAAQDVIGCSVSTVASSDYLSGVERRKSSFLDQSELGGSRQSTVTTLESTVDVFEFGERQFDYTIKVDECARSTVDESELAETTVAMSTISSIAADSTLVPEHGDCVMKAGAHTLQGNKGQVNQDTHLVLPLGKTRMLVAVFDGHGYNGHIAAARARDIFAQKAPCWIPEAPASLSDEAAEAVLRKLFGRVHSTLMNELDSNGQLMAYYSGTTATAAIIDTDIRTMTCAHVGDSALLLSNSGNVQFLTRDHVVDEASEMRIRAHGGEVREMLIGGITARRIFVKGSGVPGLMMDRSLGDLLGHELGMLSNPEIKTGLPVGPGSMVIVASDGVWEHHGTQQVLAFAAHSDAQQSAKNLVEMTRAGCASHPLIDDITAVVVMVEPEHPSGME